MNKSKHISLVIRFVIPVVFIIRLDWNVCTCLKQLYDGRDMYRIYYIKNNYMFLYISLPSYSCVRQVHTLQSSLICF